jgi:hypothetical protein
VTISRGIQRLWVIIKLKDNSLNQLGNGKIKSLIVPKTKKLAILILKSKNMKQIFKKEGIMKGVMLVCAILALFVSSPAQSQTLFDDFTGPLLDSSKWYGNYVWVTNTSNHLEIGQVITKGKLDMFNHCLGSTLDDNSGTTTCSTRLIIQDGSGITAMQALVQPTALAQGRCSGNDVGTTWIRIGGAFFNGSTDAPLDQTNDVQAHISLSRDANSTDPAGILTIEGVVFRCTSADCGTFVYVTTTGADNPLVLGTIAVKKKVQLSIAYDPANNRFIFTQGKGKKAVQQEILYTNDLQENFPPYMSNGGSKRLEVRHSLANCSPVPASGWARAYFDNFYTTKEP